MMEAQDRMEGAAARTILLAEDDPEDQIISLRALRAAGLTNPVECCHDGQEVLDRLLGSPPPAPDLQPCLLLLDLNMPRVRGEEVLRVLRADPHWSQLPIVVMTVESPKEAQARVAALGANGFICKMTMFRKYVDAVRVLARQVPGVIHSDATSELGGGAMLAP